ncbi:MAG: ATP-binding protein [Coriobacteriia bacterium]|nr:ATP-binding protein [Coriobacteriia bacterium]
MMREFNAVLQQVSGMHGHAFVDFVRDDLLVMAVFLFLVALIVAVCVLCHLPSLRIEARREANRTRILKEALLRAERAASARDLLLRNLSHDVRTPLNGIVGALDIAASRSDDPVLHECMDKARMSSQQLLRLMDNLLEMCKLETDTFELAQERFSLPALMDRLIGATRPFADEAQIDLRYAPDAEFLSVEPVVGSPLYVRQLVGNVLDNAIRYNKKNGWVKISTSIERLECGKLEFLCVVEDSGIGMGEDYLAHVFEPFSQESAGPRSEYAGSGLGLSITKSLVDRMNGTLAITSTEGEGTKVVISLPFALASENDEGLSACKGEGPGVAGSEAQACPIRPLEGLRCLLVEDNALNLEISRTLLEEAGAKTLVAHDGQEALELFEASAEGSIDAILMDVMMPVMDGREATRRIRALNRPDASKVFIVAVTASDLAEDRRIALEAGMDGFMPKPVDFAALVLLLSRLKGDSSK